jgi:hypothetical protein
MAILFGWRPCRQSAAHSARAGVRGRLPADRAGDAGQDRRPPTNPREILKRLDQTHFNAPSNAELEALKLGLMLRAAPKMRRLHVSCTCAEVEFEGLADENGADLGWDFLERLRDSGRKATDIWIEQLAV